ncbi:MAG: EAL domain-containing protein [Epsilonproteobacteria bacterium]|nr:EAL domain-containing protein [Campylobacterota bacterium]
MIRQKEILVNVYIDALVEESKSDKKYYIITIQDLTEVKKTSEMAYQHKLTGMPNQMKAMQDIPILFSKIHTQNNKIALALMQFDNFSRLRSIVGYEQSNEVIVTFSNYLTTIVSEMNVNVYHTFDNHFLLTISNVNSVDDVKALIIQLQTKLAELYKMEDTNLHLTVSVGVAIYPESGPTRKLLDNTYKALDMAQNEGDGNIVIYLPSKLQNEFDELRLHNDMKSGLEKGEFEVYYQPIIDVENEEVVAAEALIRWIHPELGFIPPDVFIGLMEKTGFITKLGQFVLEEVLKQQKRWELFKFRPIKPT